MKKVLAFIFLSIFVVNLLPAQISDQQSKIIATYEGFPPVPFEAPDVNGVKHFLPDYKDNVVLLYFWNLDCTDCKAYLGMVNELANEFKSDDLIILSLADEEKDEIQRFTQKALVNFPIIPNGKGLSDMGYAPELPYPKAFLIDKFGIIQKVLVAGTENFYGELKQQIEKYLNK